MNDLDERDYREKNNWRRWVWNRIVERLAVPPSIAKVMYFAAADNLDADVARRKGFRDCNLVPIDRNKNKIKVLRDAGHLCIEGDGYAVAANFGKPLHVVYFDFCNGLQADTVSNIFELMNCDHLRHAVFAINLLRGRDPSSNAIRQHIVARFNPPAAQRKHRGLLLLNTLASEIRDGLIEIFYNVKLEQGSESELRELMIDRQQADPTLRVRWATTVNRMLEVQKQSAYTHYSSKSGLVFDTVVFKNLFSYMGDSDVPYSLAECYPDLVDADVRRKLAAFRAHQNMRHGMVV